MTQPGAWSESKAAKFLAFHESSARCINSALVGIDTF
jgi:hypothetical protein